MSALKAKPLQERFGFLDEDLKTPGHDALMLWIDEYMPEILAEVFKLSVAPRIIKKRWEYVIKNERGFLIGAADMHVLAAGRDEGLSVFIEAKTKILSLGELLRQINFYKSGGDLTEYYLTPRWLVISPDDRFADKIREQGVFFKKSPDV